MCNPCEKHKLRSGHGDAEPQVKSAPPQAAPVETIRNTPSKRRRVVKKHIEVETDADEDEEETEIEEEDEGEIEEKRYGGKKAPKITEGSTASRSNVTGTIPGGAKVLHHKKMALLREASTASVKKDTPKSSVDTTPLLTFTPPNPPAFDPPTPASIALDPSWLTMDQQLTMPSPLDASPFVTPQLPILITSFQSPPLMSLSSPSLKNSKTRTRGASGVSPVIAGH